jgi:hypothetical protein
MTLLPKEHGAYGQITLPLASALIVGGLSTPGLMLTTSAVATFVAHEPLSILLGLRGARASRDLRRTAMRWLACAASVAVIAAGIAGLTMPHDVRWSIAVPAIPAALLAIAIVRGREKSWYGEVAAALAFAGLAVQVTMAAGASLRSAAAVAIPFALLFVTSTLAVRTVILRVRGGGNRQAMASTRLSAFVTVSVSTIGLTWLAAVDVLPRATIAAAAPGLLAALVIAARPPLPTRLRQIGWTLVAVSVLTAVIVVVMV